MIQQKHGDIIQTLLLKWESLVIFLLLVIALVPRLLYLGHAIVADEQLWISRSKEFAKAMMSMDLSATHVSNHPGVLTMWLGAISTGIANLIYGYKSYADLLFAAQLPFSLATAATVAVFYILAKKAFNNQIAFLAAILLALDVFYLAFSRIIHLDAILTSVMILSFLSILVFYTNSNSGLWLVVSSVFGGLSVLAKVSGVFMVPMVALVSLTYAVVQYASTRRQLMRVVKTHLVHLAAWLAIAFFTAYLIWPAMWGNPITLFELFMRGPGMVAHEQGQFFLGRPVDDPGMLFYLLVIAFRTTPLSMLLFCSGFIGLLLRWLIRGNKTSKLELNLSLCVAYLFFFILMMSIPDKKAGRYILPVFPAIALIGGWGAYCVVNTLKRVSHKQPIGNTVFVVVGSVIGLIQLYNVITVFPYCLAYYNPLAGGPQIAEKAILIGRGEGMDLVAAYLNEKPRPESLVVASEFEYLLGVHFKGSVAKTTVTYYEPGILKKCDFLVVYISGRQKRFLRLAEEVIDYHEKNTPEKIIRINGIAYAYIYDLKKAGHR
jgi:4-amino-4-deoxy-L-arabinose transferase-like glycosyltransferase